MKLIEFLITESKKGWKWPDGIVKVASTKGSRGVNFYFDYACPPSLSNTLIAPTLFSSSELVTREKYDAALAASKTEWDGEGLPPVGCECEGKQLAQLNWNKFKVVAIENGHVFGFWNDNVSTGLDSRLWEFRPIQSEADKKRDEAVKALREIIGGPRGPYAQVKAGEIYDAIKSGKIIID